MEELQAKPKNGLFHFIKNVLDFVQNYFKAMIFLLICFLLFISSNSTNVNNANLMRIDLKGVIMESDTILDSISKASQNPNIRGVLLVVDSPGGAVAPSLEISMAVKRLSEQKPVVAYAAGTMASGSYYASANADYIIANPGSMIGSIGVIMQTYNIEELTKKLGISEQVVKAGDFKEAGTAMREWTKDERASLQELVNDIYNLFIDDIIEARGLERSKVNEFANARVFIASKAKNAGLIDEVGSIEDAKNTLVKIAMVQTPVWKEPDLIDKLSKKLAAQARSEIASLLFGVKAY
ncbi:MAG: signal peptide peptidase SppA [Campylobacteraceae bacterium]|jgi:protease-4|nr:signal peptide peptidase SppA [Campylobacteraceae bacterium]